jgi:hypothetical protein
MRCGNAGAKAPALHQADSRDIVRGSSAGALALASELVQNSINNPAEGRRGNSSCR